MATLLKPIIIFYHKLSMYLRLSFLRVTPGISILASVDNVR